MPPGSLARMSATSPALPPAVAVIADHIPEAAPGSKGGAARAWLDAAEEADRKNARVIDKLEFALPIELDQAQRIKLVRAFVQELAGGNAPSERHRATERAAEREKQAKLSGESPYRAEDARAWSESLLLRSKFRSSF